VTGDTDGPFLQAALICERVLREQDGVLSAIRVIDRLVRRAGPDAPDELAPFEQPIEILLLMKSGAARGRFELTIGVEKPSGEQGEVLEVPVHFEGEDRGIQVVLPMSFAADQEGLYWFDIGFEGTRITRMPLRVLYQRDARSV
jgi:hypothetical protein